MNKAMVYIGDLDLTYQKAIQDIDETSCIFINGQDFWPSKRKGKFLLSECTLDTKTIVITNYPAEIFSLLYNLVVEPSIYINKKGGNYFMMPTPQIVVTSNCTISDLPDFNDKAFWRRFHVSDLNLKEVSNDK